MSDEREQERQPAPAAPAAAPAPAEHAPVHAPVQGAGPVPSVTPPAAGGGTAQTASEQAYHAGAGGPEIEATDQALGQHMVDGMNKANGGGTFDTGIHYWYNYKRICDKRGADVWQDKWRAGHTKAPQFINPHENGTWMDWELKKGESASKAIKAWLAGATVAECLSSVVAMEIDSLRAAIGDKEFDATYGSDDPTVDAQVNARMHVRAGIAGTPVAHYIKPTAVAKKAGRGEAITDKDMDSLVPGQWYYFYNHPKYLLKHPGGAWQGENALYMGKNGAGERLWAGLGADGKTEDTMVDEMVGAYNAARTDYDLRMLKENGQMSGDGSFSDKRYDPASGEFPDTVTKADILTAPEYELNGRSRKGGFKPDAGKGLDADAVKKARP